MNNIVISSGHGKLIRGASGYIDEVDEARKVVNKVASYLNNVGVSVEVFHDDTSTTQDQNLNTIVNFHNSKNRDLDVSVHFNAYETTNDPMGTECLYVTQAKLAEEVSGKISSDGGFKNRGPKKRTDLFFLNQTNEPSILIEVCFVDSRADVELYGENFEAICAAISEGLSGISQPPLEGTDEPARPERPSASLFTATGKVSNFGGPEDTGVSPSEGLAFFTAVEQAPHLFLLVQPPGTTGLARRLNPKVHYVACRWDYDKTPKSMLANGIATVRAIKTGITRKAFPADWGPHEDTGRIADISPGLMEDLGITTDDHVEVIFPA